MRNEVIRLPLLSVADVQLPQRHPHSTSSLTNDVRCGNYNPKSEWSGTWDHILRVLFVSFKNGARDPDGPLPQSLTIVTLDRPSRSISKELNGHILVNYYQTWYSPYSVTWYMMNPKYLVRWCFHHNFVFWMEVYGHSNCRVHEASKNKLKNLIKLVNRGKLRKFQTARENHNIKYGFSRRQACPKFTVHVYKH